jgi:hypothetical protein
LKELSKDHGGDNATGDRRHIQQVKQIMNPENQLKHALDTVRQFESIRFFPADAHSMNEILQCQIGELNAKNEELASAKKEQGNAFLLDL